MVPFSLLRGRHDYVPKAVKAIPEKMGLAIGVGAYTANAPGFVLAISVLLVFTGIFLNRRLTSRLMVVGELLSEFIIGLLAHLLIVITVRGWSMADMVIIHSAVVLSTLALGIVLNYYFNGIPAKE